MPNERSSDGMSERRSLGAKIYDFLDAGTTGMFPVRVFGAGD